MQAVDYLAPRPGLEPGTCGLTVSTVEYQFHHVINCLRCPRNVSITVECSATHGHAILQCYIFVYSSKASKTCCPVASAKVGSSILLVSTTLLKPTALRL